MSPGAARRVAAKLQPSRAAGFVLVDSGNEDIHDAFRAHIPEALHKKQAGRMSSNREGLTGESINAGMRELREGKATLGSRPLLVLSAGRRPPPLANVSVDIDAELWRAAQQAQRALATLSTNSLQTIVYGSGHDIPREAPGELVAAVLEVVRAVRTNTRVNLS